MTPPTEEGAKLNQSVRKAVALLRATAEDAHANVSSLARAAGLPRATALRMIQTLEEEGFLLRVPGDDRVLLGPGLLRLARSTDEQLLLREVCAPFLTDLVAALRESVTLSVVAPDGGLDVVAQVDAPQLLRPESWVGRRFPLHASASGKLLLAGYDAPRLERVLAGPLPASTTVTITTGPRLRDELDVIRTQGYAVTRDELEDGLSGVAVGVHGAAGELLAVISLSGPTQRLDPQRQQVVDRLLDAAERVEQVLGQGRPAPAVLDAGSRASA